MGANPPKKGTIVALPTYSYECKRCGNIQNIFHGMTAKPRVKCEACGGTCHKLFGTGAGIIFKGGGFYETDFKDKKGTPPEKAKSETGAPKSENKKKNKGTAAPDTQRAAKGTSPPES